MKTCSVENCGCRPRARGFCDAHYDRSRRYGSPTGGPPLRSKNGEARRFLEQVVLLHTNAEECLFWPFATARGYGKIGIGGKTQLVHRIACAHRHGEPEKVGMVAAHSCGRGDKGCVNPMHLRWATEMENAADKIEHGTHRSGETMPWARLTENSVRSIRQKLSDGGRVAALATEFKISRGAIQAIKQGRSWRDLL